ncbi:bifunctional adenosylcobinamide kinase/adenosylcobinamide-phosphate guanylyltransferase [Tessaracoccus sp. ZS01]|nr:bifunctional adenosylcobinamide kinase/adenosylcobinamide-phosphate guanylyltransferase [Tessaracoccus sp. ZS01]MCG6567369.1 bifunctional adenosylcobinamide kinase/adenosylcobinamide-phosphate guanylyltransferase [Tessaracoccus sp. ZS01]OMG56944.1 bifunctional adenosylcobinamide kinase/adenosylcobinamide-phosphate guanylyltransferase [Tessaracoccus sp. ZS01]
MQFTGGGTALVLGGARSGKSTWAEAQFAGVADVEYVATSELRDGDTEWAHRVALHRERRPGTWRTTETLDIGAVLEADDEAPVLVDCVAVWFDRVLLEAGAWDDAPGWRDTVAARTQSLVEAVRATRRSVILVSNEVGLGVVPATASGRLYRDELGRLNASLATAVDEVWFCVAGIAKRWA